MSKKTKKKPKNPNSFLPLISTRAQEEKSTRAEHLEKLARCSGEAPSGGNWPGGAEWPVLATVGGSRRVAETQQPDFNMQMSEENLSAGEHKLNQAQERPY